MSSNEDIHNRKASASSEEIDIKSSYAILEFKVNYESKMGQILHICGNIEELGNWNADNSPRLKTNPSLYPNWESNFNFTLPIGMTIEYKYVLIDKKNNKEWEQLPNNSVRTLTMKKPGKYLIINQMGNLDLKIVNQSTSTDIKPNSKISLNLIEKGENEDKKLKNLKFKFEKEDYSNIASELHPLDLISYENNKMTLDIFDDFDKGEIKLSNKDRIVMVTVYLPIVVEKNEKGDYNIIESDNSFLFRYVNKLKTDTKKNQINIKWIGLLKNLYDFPEEEQEEIIDYLRERDYYPVTPKKKELDYFIYYLERVMYPVFLNSSFTPTDEIFADSKKYVDAFYNVNKEYANKILSDCQEEDLITIHNIGLAFVADRLMHNKPNSHIGIYIHIDLPSSDVIKIFPYYQEIFRCFILCDVIGFHDFTSARNFLTIMRRFFGIFYNVSKKGLITLSRSGRTIIVHIKQPQLMDFVIEDPKKKCLICNTIKIFTNEFPNLSKYQYWQDIDLFELEKNLSLPDKLEEYFDIIKEYLQKNRITNENNFDQINDKIYDYIFGKIYDKIFPKEDQTDDKIFRQTVFLSWIEPKHFIQDKKNYLLDGFLPDVNIYLKKLENQKSPRKKFSHMSKIFELIRNLVKLNGDDIITGVDDQMPILNYALIKARPLRIYSNCKFMELFLGERKNKKEDNELIQLLSLCDYICNMSYSKLINVSKEEYQLKCNESAKNENSNDS